ncbi:zinc finger protein 692-like [Melopsittacus undulatus]|uniref:zinc finger protein 692-like n=1 Tax=Melopsittacus undulatus TaxID=13146 RepID=UPI00146A49AB|nr:zinc finger protein 692-like [Melopsittacus undulatus]
MDPSRPPPDCIRRQRRRELDARRSKCRIRIGGHLERWCRLKEQLGFALHSQLAQFLLDRYSSHGCVWSSGDPEPGVLHAEALQRLVVLSHGHSQECGFIPAVKAPAPGTAAPLVWECVAGHSFSWSREPGGDLGGSSRRRSMRCGGNGEPGAEPDALGAVPEAAAETGSTGKEHGRQQDEDEEDDLTYTDDLRDENYHPSLDREPEPQRRLSQSKAPKEPIKEEQPPEQLSLSPPEGKSRRVSCKRRAQGSDEDVAQIGPKRIRKAAKREILLCDFEGCGKIFSNRQYLNHHQKYQHVHQKTFTCPEPACGKSFNFKKHLKEHEKLHSDKRDYICEFCARSFRTSSNLIIHRRIHTGEKPLQCEVCGFTCRQKASLNWHMRKHGAAAGYQFSCELCGKRFEKRDNVTAHKSKSHPPGGAGHREHIPAPIVEHGDGIGMQDAGAAQGCSMEGVGAADASCLD